MSFDGIKEIKYSFDEDANITIYINGVKQEEVKYDNESNQYIVDLQK